MLLQVTPQLAGREVTCPGCEAPIRLPAMSGTAAKAGKALAVRSKAPDTTPTAVSTWQSLAWGAGATAAIAGLLYPFSKTFLGEVFFSGGWVNFAELLLFCWGMAILGLKIRKTRRQRDALLVEVLPHSLGEEITRDNVGVFLDHLAQLPARVRRSLMVARIQKGLQLFEGRGSNTEAAAFLSAQSDVDANRITGTYSLLKVFLWAIPILGFIGTVLGLSIAMQNFGSADLADMTQLKKSVSDITGGLATAFNTTLLGLILSMILMFPMSAMQKREDDMLTDIDAFCSGVLLPRLNDGGAFQGSGAPPTPEWMEDIMRRQGDYLHALVEHTAVIQQAASNMEARAAAHQQLVQDEFVKNIEKFTSAASKSITDNVKATGSYFNALSEGLKGLNDVLRDLGEKQVVIKQKKGWF